jgi:hypothetical protein
MALQSLPLSAQDAEPAVNDCFAAIVCEDGTVRTTEGVSIKSQSGLAVKQDAKDDSQHYWFLGESGSVEFTFLLPKKAKNVYAEQRNTEGAGDVSIEFNGNAVDAQPEIRGSHRKFLLSKEAAQPDNTLKFVCTKGSMQFNGLRIYYQLPVTVPAAATEERAEDDEQSRGGLEIAAGGELPKDPKPGDRIILKIKDTDFVFRYCPPGEFLMGSSNKEQLMVTDKLKNEVLPGVLPGPKPFQEQRQPQNATDAMWKDIADGKTVGMNIDDVAREIQSRTQKNLQSETQHKVALSKGFYFAETETTQEQWKAITWNSNNINMKEKDAPSGFPGERLPVEQVSWSDCQL